MFKAAVAILMAGASATNLTQQMRDEKALNSIYDALSYVQVGTEEHTYLHNALVTMTMKTDAEILESHSQIVQVPIDEKRALSFKVSPTYTLDEVNSVTLKSFRKVVGYDTFDSIRRKDRNETKDPSSYYNVTVSLMARRRPGESAAVPPTAAGAKSLASLLDKGFPYDD